MRADQRVLDFDPILAKGGGLIHDDNLVNDVPSYIKSGLLASDMTVEATVLS